jgi:hypothetical protein
MKAWHFLKADRRLRFGTQEVVEAGKTYAAEGPIRMCKNGMHGSERILDALTYAPGPIVCRVEIDGEIQFGGDKLVGRHRHVLAMADVSNVLHEFACKVAEHALKRAHVDDERCWAAIEAKRRWLRGEIGIGELAAASVATSGAASDAASVAASAAARVAASDAASAAARVAASVAANVAASVAASDAASVAASAAAKDDAWTAAEAAAWAAAWAAASAAAKEAQARLLRVMVSNALDNAGFVLATGD